MIDQFKIDSYGCQVWCSIMNQRWLRVKSLVSWVPCWECLLFKRLRDMVSLWDVMRRLSGWGFYVAYATTTFVVLVENWLKVNEHGWGFIFSYDVEEKSPYKFGRHVDWFKKNQAHGLMCQFWVSLFFCSDTFWKMFENWLNVGLRC